MFPAFHIDLTNNDDDDDLLVPSEHAADLTGNNYESKDYKRN